MSKISRWTKRMSQSTRELVGDVTNVLSGIRQYKKEGETPQAAYLSMRRLFRNTNGRFNDVMGTVCKAFHPKRKVSLQQSLFQGVTLEEVRSIGRQLKADGCYQFERKLPAPLCDALLEFSLSQPGIDVTQDASQRVPKIFDRSQPYTVRHQFDAAQLFQCNAVQQLATDPYFFAIAQEYLGFHPVQDLISMWWSAPGDEAHQSRAAQLYHYDMDRLKFVKFFVYLTEVDSSNGPHCYVRGSHTRKPNELLRDERISDDEIRDHYDASDLRELTGPTGTLLAVDTRGFHKGKPLVDKDRLIFQIQFADSLFGQNYPNIRIDHGVPQATREKLKNDRRCYANFDIVDHPS